MANEQKNYKDTVFRMVFKDKENLLSLYNTVNGTDYENPKELEITTLENALYMNMKNDISCVMDFSLNLYEHQSTVNPNIPLRDLFYVSKILQGLIVNEDLYSPRRIHIPVPRFYVFYNGLKEMPEQWEMRLSESCIRLENGEKDSMLELTVQAFNINFGKNEKLLDTCQKLKEYAQYVDRIRHYAKKMPLKEAIERAITECIKEGILSDFLKKNRAEALEMSWYEYNEELHLKNERQIAYEEGLENGVKQGLEQGLENGVKQTILRMHKNGYSLNQIAEIAAKTLEEVQAVIEKEESLSI